MPDPSDAELDVLKLFWRYGPLSVRQTQDRTGPALGWAASTTRTVLERMVAKGVLERREAEGVAVYAPVESKTAVLGRALRKFARDVLEIDGPLPASAFTGSQILSAEELAELETLINAKDEDA